MVLIPNFNVIRGHVIDPMHCLFLGLAKHAVQVWKEKDILQSRHFMILQERVDAIIPPSKVGRIPLKIESGFASFTADEWKNWIQIYSVYALHGTLDDDVLVEACFVLCQPVLIERTC